MLWCGCSKVGGGYGQGSVGVVDVDVVRDRLAGVVVLEPVVVDDRLAAVDISDSSCG